MSQKWIRIFNEDESLTDSDKLVKLLSEGIKKIFPNSILKIQNKTAKSYDSYIHFYFYLGEEKDFINQSKDNSPFKLRLSISPFKQDGSLSKDKYTSLKVDTVDKDMKGYIRVIPDNGNTQSILDLPRSNFKLPKYGKLKTIEDCSDYIINEFKRMKKLLIQNYDRLHKENKIILDKNTK